MRVAVRGNEAVAGCAGRCGPGDMAWAEGEAAAPAGDDPKAGKNDKIGLIFFVAGLLALIVAVAYAGWLYTSSKAPTMSLVVRSTPTGAQISLDGVIMGNAPQMFEGVPSDQEHVIVMELPGYKACTRRVAPTEVASLSIDCDLETR